MSVSWDASGLLEIHWGSVGGRDKLAEKTGIRKETLSGYNTGRLPLGIRNARRIAETLGISVLELGAPETLADEQGLPLIARLVEVRSEVAELTKDVRRLTRRVVALERRVPPALEGPPGAAPQAQ